jgi:hypothetical protein
MRRADRAVSPSSAYPVAIDPTKVGTYPPDAKSGAGYFYDDVLEYRVWLHPDRGATPLNGDEDYFVAFAQYERAEAFSKTTAGAEQPIVLVRQREWIAEPMPGKFHAERGDRVTEWRVKCQLKLPVESTESSARPFTEGIVRLVPPCVTIDWRNIAIALKTLDLSATASSKHSCYVAALMANTSVKTAQTAPKNQRRESQIPATTLRATQTAIHDRNARGE